MATVAVEVPPGLVPALRESALLLYQATAESLHHTLESERGTFSEEVHEHRDRLSRLDALLSGLGWSEEPPASAGLQISAPRDLMHDTVYGALIDAGERLAAACEEVAAEPQNERIGAAAREVIALDGLLTSIASG